MRPEPHSRALFEAQLGRRQGHDGLHYGFEGGRRIWWRADSVFSRGQVRRRGLVRWLDHAKPVAHTVAAVARRALSVEETRELAQLQASPFASSIDGHA